MDLPSLFTGYQKILDADQDLREVCLVILPPIVRLFFYSMTLF